MAKQVEIPDVSALRFLRNARQILKNPLPFHQANFTRLGDTFRLHSGIGKPLLFTRNPELAQYVLQKNQKNYLKSEIQTRDLAKYIGYGLLTINGEPWRKQRKLIQPAFHKQQLIQLLDEVQKAIVGELQKITTEEAVNIYPIMNDLTFQTVVKALFSGAAGEADVARLQYVTETAQKMLIAELRQPYLNWWFELTGKTERNVAFSRSSADILKRIVDERRKEPVKKGDLLDMLMEATYEDGTTMSEEQLIDEILVLFLAGHETTANALTFCCELLARNGQVQEKLYAEVKQTSGMEDLMERIQKSPYAHAVINEVMRLYPPVYFIDRVSMENDVYNGVTIPKNTSILMSVYEIHRHTDYWEQPLAFMPERFLEDTNRNSIAYYPFGAGPRKCIGNNFAIFEMVLAVSELLKRFSIEPTSAPIEIEPLISLKPKNAILQFIAR